jgi:hypothetical protein
MFRFRELLERASDEIAQAIWREHGKATITQPREDGATVQSWLWAPPAKHSTRQIDQVLERIELLRSLKADQHLGDLPEAIVRRYARRLASRAPAVAARIAEPKYRHFWHGNQGDPFAATARDSDGIDDEGERAQIARLRHGHTRPLHERLAACSQTHSLWPRANGVRL